MGFPNYEALEFFFFIASLWSSGRMMIHLVVGTEAQEEGF